MTLLLQWLWQGSLLAVGLAGALRLAPRVNAATRYALWWLAFAAVLVLPLIDPALAYIGSEGAGAPPPAGPLEAARILIALPVPPDWVIGAAAGAWIGSVVLGAGRIVQGVRTLGRLKRQSRPLPMAIARSLHRWQGARRGGRRARLRASSAISGACALGLAGRPTIVVSDRLLATVDRDTLDLIVLHEQMHLSRGDDWARLIQSCIGAVTGLHPAVRLITRQLDVEREAACDEAVAARTGDPRRYAASLADAADAMAGRHVLVAPAVVPNAAGTGSLLSRIERLLDGRVTRRASLQPAALGSGVGVLAGVAAFIVSVGPQVVLARTGGADAAPQPAAIAAPAGQPAVNGTVAAGAGTRPVARPVTRKRVPRSAPPRGTLVASPGIRSSQSLPVATNRRGATPSSADETSATMVPVATDQGTPDRSHAAVPLPATPIPVFASMGSSEAAAVTRGGAAGGDAGATLGQHVARAGVATGDVSRRASAAIASYFGRAGKAVAGRF